MIRKPKSFLDNPNLFFSGIIHPKPTEPPSATQESHSDALGIDLPSLPASRHASAHAASAPSFGSRTSSLRNPCCAHSTLYTHHSPGSSPPTLPLLRRPKIPTLTLLNTLRQ